MRAVLSGAKHRQGGGCCSERLARKDGGRLRTVLVLLHSTTAVVLQGKMGYTIERVPWHEGWIAMMLYIAIEERERERESHRLPLPPSRCARKCSIYVGEKKCEY